MIKIELSVREALNMVASSHCSMDLFEKIVTSFETALGVNSRCNVTITRGMSTNNRIPCIKAIRLRSGWGLREAKNWTDVLVGRYDERGFWVNGGNSNTITLKTPEAAEVLLRELTNLGCEGFLS